MFFFSTAGNWALYNSKKREIQVYLISSLGFFLRCQTGYKYILLSTVGDPIVALEPLVLREAWY